VRRLSLAREPLGFAVLSSFGAALVVQAIVELAIIALYPIVGLGKPLPFGLRASSIWERTGDVAAGAVAMRAGGLPAVAGYVALRLLDLLSITPLVGYSCARNAFVPLPQPCDYPSLVASRWPVWLAVVLGAVAYRIIAERGEGSNVLLRGAGALSLGVIVGSRVGSLLLWLGLVTTPSALLGSTETSVYVLALGTIAGAIVAGVILGRAPWAAVVLLALLLIGPSFAANFPLLAQQSGLSQEPLRMLLMRVSWFWTPLVASLALFGAWLLVRRPVGTVT
jgi:hypothetical protein